MKSNESTDTYSVIKNETGIIKIPKDSKKAIQLNNVSTSIHLPAEKVNAPGVATKNGVWVVVFNQQKTE